MPVEVVGLKEAMIAMRKLQPTLDKELKTEVRSLLNPIVKKAKTYVPDEIAGLSNWFYNSKPNKIDVHTSMFRVGKFPKFNPAQVRAGIKSEIFPSKPNRSGFISLIRIVNLTAAGAIYETAGRRRNGVAQPWNPKAGGHDYSHSQNPQAGQHFIDSMKRQMVGTGKMRGRLIYRAWAEDQGKVQGHIMQAINRTLIKTKKFIDASEAFGRAA